MARGRGNDQVRWGMFKAPGWVGAVLAAAILLVALPVAAVAQFLSPIPLSQQDPKLVLATLIGAFQRCGPTWVYQLLGPVVFQAVWQQTGGSGCYLVLQQAGELRSLVRTGSIDLPAGPVVSYRATHDRAAAIWQIGISRWTNRVEWLTYAPASGGGAAPLPGLPGGSESDDRSKPPDVPSITLGNPAVTPPGRSDDSSSRPATPAPSQRPPATTDPEQGCVIYPVMCRRGPA